MYMQPICKSALGRDPVQIVEFRTQFETRKVRRLALKVAFGSLFLLLIALIMPAYWMAVGAWLAVAGSAKLAISSAQLVYASILCAGEAIVGR